MLIACCSVCYPVPIQSEFRCVHSKWLRVAGCTLAILVLVSTLKDVQYCRFTEPLAWEHALAGAAHGGCRCGLSAAYPAAHHAQPELCHG